MKKTDMTLPDNHRIDEEKYKSLLQYIRLNVTEKYDFPQEIVQVDGVTVATLGNFSASTGKPKSKKTFNVSAIVASALSGKEVLKYKAELPPCKNRVLYIDTEQSKCHCHKVLHRILKLAGMPTDRENDRIEFFVLREYTPDQRRDIIRWALHEEQNIGLVIIDGIRDLIHDINSPSESLDIINELMRWSSYYELHIHTVLHLNKGDDNTRGHIGSELNNKAETILQISKSVENGRISEVRAMHIRDREFTPFAFEIGEDSLPRLVKDHQFKMSKTRPAVLVHGYDRAAAPYGFGSRLSGQLRSGVSDAARRPEKRIRQHRLQPRAEYAGGTVQVPHTKRGHRKRRPRVCLQREFPHKKPVGLVCGYI